MEILVENYTNHAILSLICMKCTNNYNNEIKTIIMYDNYQLQFSPLIKENRDVLLHLLKPYATDLQNGKWYDSLSSEDM